jgi:glycosyltransferase involved in cell wall biosynthesis
LWTVDASRTALDACRQAVAPWDQSTVFVESDSIEFLAQWDPEKNGTIDLLYLDSLDFQDEERCTAHCLLEAQAAFDKLSTIATIVIDDTRLIGPPRSNTPGPFHGKGALAVPWLLERGFDLAWCFGKQAMLARSGPPTQPFAAAKLTSPTSVASLPVGSARSRGRMLWCSNAPWVPSGYGVQTRLFVPRIANAGFDTAIVPFFGLMGGPIGWQGIKLYPGSGHKTAQDILGAHARDFQADFVIFHADAWVLDFNLLGRGIRIVPWFPVDSDPIPEAVAQCVRQSWRGVTFSRFGQRKAAEAGLDVAYVPLGVDTSAYRPIEKKLARGLCGMPDDAFVIGMVALNVSNPSRKAFPEVFQAFAQFRRRHRDARLYLHSHPRGVEGKLGVDLIALAQAVGIEDHVHFAPDYALAMGAADSEMAAFYSALDVLLAPSHGEGCGVPILEAQACGRPVIVGGWTGMPEHCFAGVQIPKSEAEAVFTPLQSWQFSPRVGAIVEALEQIRRDAGRPGLDEATARSGALGHDAATVTQTYWVPVLESLMTSDSGGVP